MGLYRVLPLVAALLAGASATALGAGQGSCWVSPDVSIPRENAEYEAGLRKLRQDEAAGNVGAEEGRSLRDALRQSHRNRLEEIENLRRIPQRDLPMCPIDGVPAAQAPAQIQMESPSIALPRNGAGAPNGKLPYDIFHASEMSFPGKADPANADPHATPAGPAKPGAPGPELPAPSE